MRPDFPQNSCSTDFSRFNPQWLEKDKHVDFKWISSEPARLFEKGLISPDQFADSLIADLSLDVQKDQLLDYFTFWPSGLYPGVERLLSQLQTQYTLAVFSNTNLLHWPRLMDEMNLGQFFDFKFASHLIHMAKPEPEVFEYVIKQLNVSVKNILFLDDNPGNVNVARLFVIQAELVRGEQDLLKIIEQMQI